MSSHESLLTLPQREQEKQSTVPLDSGEKLFFPSPQTQIDWIQYLQTHPPLVGLLRVTATERFSPTNRQVPQYICRPISRHLPEFLVPSTLVKTWLKKRPGTLVPDHYVLITFHSWSITQARPRGSIHQLLGPLGDWTSEAQARAAFYQLLLPKAKLSPSRLSIQLINQVRIDGTNEAILDRREPEKQSTIPSDSGGQSISSPPQTIPHRNCLTVPVYSIDPVGCRDIDDAFSVEELPHQQSRLGIHIADVTFFLTQCQLFQQAINFENRFASIYLWSSDIRHLLPEILATHHISLLPTQSRLVWSLWLTYDHQQQQWQPPVWERTLIRNRRAFSYVEADQYLLKADASVRRTLSDDNPTPNWSLLCQLIIALKNKILWPTTPSNENCRFTNHQVDSHQLIETLMLTANHLTAKYLHSQWPDKMLHRVHQSGVTGDSDSTTNQDPELSRFLTILQSDSAEYRLTSCQTPGQSSNPPLYHTGLQLKEYTHYTSPIRRAADIYIHYLLAATIYQQPLPFDISHAWVKELNNFVCRSKKLQRDLDFLKLVQLVVNEEIEKFQSGYLIDPNFQSHSKNQTASDIDDPPELHLYLPAIKLFISYPVFPTDLKHQLVSTQTNNFFRCWFVQQPERRIEFPKHQLLSDIQLVAQPTARNFKQKLQIQLPGWSKFLTDQ